MQRKDKLLGIDSTLGFAFRVLIFPGILHLPCCFCPPFRRRGVRPSRRIPSGTIIHHSLRSITLSCFTGLFGSLCANRVLCPDFSAAELSSTTFACH